MREPGQQNRTIKEIVKEMFSYTDGATMSSKKDALVNMGGFLAFNDDGLAQEVQSLEILTEGYPTYGGLAGRDLAALAQGLKEVVEEDYLEYRIKSTQYLGNALMREGIPLVKPIGGHAVYLDAKAMLPHIPSHELPAQALCCEAYLQGGIRSVEIGTLMFGRPNPNGGHDIPSTMELLRLAIPRRVYTQSHIDYVIEVMAMVNKNKNNLKGLKITEQPPYLRHFTAKMAPL